MPVFLTSDLHLGTPLLNDCNLCQESQQQPMYSVEQYVGIAAATPDEVFILE